MFSISGILSQRGSDAGLWTQGLAGAGPWRLAFGAAEGPLRSAMRLLPCQLPLRDSDFSWGSRAVPRGAAAVASGEEMQARALRRALGSVSGLSLVGRAGRGGEVRASLGSLGPDGWGQQQDY